MFLQSIILSINVYWCYGFLPILAISSEGHLNISIALSI